MINKVILIGNLGKDPEVRHLESNQQVARFSLATNENYQDKDGNWQTVTEWHNIVLWGTLASRAESRLKKGMQIFVEGKITTRKWTDSEGKDRYTTEIVGQSYRILGKREDEISSRPDQGHTGFSGPSEPNNFPGGQPEDLSSQQEDDLPF
jgi:single-strand DNA-binding protein